MPTQNGNNMYQIVRDIECNRCHETYQDHERTLAVMYGHSYFSICPKCTEEIATLMGYTKDTLTKHLSLIKEAETENNKKRRLEEGVVCRKCENRFAEGEPRIRKSSSSNVESWHIKCYDA